MQLNLIQLNLIQLNSNNKPIGQSTAAVTPLQRHPLAIDSIAIRFKSIKLNQFQLNQLTMRLKPIWPSTHTHCVHWPLSLSSSVQSMAIDQRMNQDNSIKDNSIKMMGEGGRKGVIRTADGCRLTSSAAAAATFPFFSFLCFYSFLFHCLFIPFFFTLFANSALFFCLSVCLSVFHSFLSVGLSDCLPSTFQSKIIPLSSIQLTVDKIHFNGNSCIHSRMKSSE